MKDKTKEEMRSKDNSDTDNSETENGPTPSAPVDERGTPAREAFEGLAGIYDSDHYIAVGELRSMVTPGELMLGTETEDFDLVEALDRYDGQNVRVIVQSWPSTHADAGDPGTERSEAELINESPDSLTTDTANKPAETKPISHPVEDREGPRYRKGDKLAGEFLDGPVVCMEILLTSRGAEIANAAFAAGRLEGHLEGARSGVAAYVETEKDLAAGQASSTDGAGLAEALRELLISARTFRDVSNPPPLDRSKGNALTGERTVPRRDPNDDEDMRARATYNRRLADLEAAIDTAEITLATTPPTDQEAENGD